MKTMLLIVAFSFIQFTLPAQTIHSPNGKLSLTFGISLDGEPNYKLDFAQKLVILTSKLGIEIKDQPSFTSGFKIVKTDTSVFDQTWQPVWGEEKQIRNHYQELKVTLVQPEIKNRTMILVFRLFDDGLGFRYEFPAQEGLNYVIVTDEKTEFNLTGNHKTFWIPGDYDSQEYVYYTTPLNEVDAFRGKDVTEIGLKAIYASNAVQTPLMLKTADGLYINIHEAGLVNYPAMNLLVNKETFSLTSQLVPDVLGNKAYLQAPFKTPWRTVIVSDKAIDILASRIILNLNEPTHVSDVSWIKPQKFVGIWWEMHIGKATWEYSPSHAVDIYKTDWAAQIPNGKHGATTERTKQYIDFAAENGIDGVLVEGWDVGWEDWWGMWKEEVFDFVTPYPDFNVVELQQYATSKKVKLIMHHETSSSVTNYERQMDTAYRFMNHFGYNTVKTGYVGRIIPRGEHHDGQWMVNHYIRVAEKTAQYHIMLDAHEPVRPTGLQRTYPNWMACEAARGNEFNAWSVGNPPEHETILPFTRLMGGPLDYTPGIFQIKLDKYRPGATFQVHTTLAKQLALYVTLYSPLQMAADLPENYKAHMDAFQFIKDVAVDWDITRIIEAEPGDYLTIARKAKNKEEWFIGAITDEQARISKILLDFLDTGKKYLATFYTDAPDAHWKTDPMVYQIESLIVTNKTLLFLQLAPGGGAAVSIKLATHEDLKKYKGYKSKK